MAKHTIEVARALRATAYSLQHSPDYQWGHMGSCNCGFLAQEITGLNKRQIHNSAMERHGDWNEQLHDYCPSSGLRVDDIISEMLKFGFDSDDLKHLEKLSDPVILSQLGESERHLERNNKNHVIIYLNAWSSLIEQQIVVDVQLADMFVKDKTYVMLGEDA